MNKYVIQHDNRDCGAACLSMMAYSFGTKISLAYCRELTKTDKDGTNIIGIVNGAKAIGLDAEALQGEAEELFEELENGSIHFPFIAHIVTSEGLLHFVTIFSYRNSVFVVGDPARGKIKMSKSEFIEHWTGYVITFKKTDQFQPIKNISNNLLFLRYVSGQKVRLCAIFILSIFVALIGIISSFIFQICISKAESLLESSEHNHESMGLSSELFAILENKWGYSVLQSLSIIFISLIALLIVKEIVSFFRGYLIALVGKYLDTNLILDYYNHLINLPVSSISLRNTGEYMSRFKDADIIRECLSTGAISIVLDTIMAVGCGIILYFECPSLFPVCIAIILLYAVVYFIYNKPLENTSRNTMEKNAVFQSYFKETIDGISTIKATGAENIIEENIGSKFRDYVNALFKESIVNVSQDMLINLFQSVGTAIILWIGFAAVLQGEVSVGTLISFYALLAYFIEPAKNLIGIQSVFKEAYVAADRLNDILSLSCEPSVCPDESIEYNINNWDMKKLSFRYGNRKEVLKNISFSISRGERIGIVGKSGCGKTTIAKLLLKYYSPTSGVIEANGKDVSLYNTGKLREKIAYVEQSTFLFSDTIMNNLKLGNKNVSEEEVKTMCKLCDADTFINELPFGYDSILEENGINLSGGQRQRLALVRALLKHPDLLILDESTSNLDVNTEKKITDTINKLCSEMCCIIIAHRLTSVMDCDKIIVIDNGEIVEEGIHTTLMNQKGFYYNYWEKQ